MNGAAWWLVERASQPLEPDEREAVRGDLAESGESSWQALTQVLGLLVRREAALWKDWRPWLSTFGVAVPATFLLMGASLSVILNWQRALFPVLLKAGPGFSALLCSTLLLLGWSWTAGFLVGSTSRRTVWATVALCCLPCLFCLSRFRVESLSRFSLLLFVLPAGCGVRRGLRITRIKLLSAIVLAAAVTALTIPGWSRRSSWIPDSVLTWPAWYLVATATKNGGGEKRWQPTLP
jgi:hypothetical protein